MVARVHLAQSEPEMARDRQTLGAPSATENLFAAIDVYEAGARRRRPRPISRTRSLAAL